MTIIYLPGRGHYVEMHVFVPDGENVRALVGPYRTADLARAYGPKAERGVLHLRESTP